MARYYIGIDGGGTQSRLLVASEDMEPLLRLQGGSTNPDSNTKEAVSATLGAMFLELRNNGFLEEDCKGLCIGVAGINSAPAAKDMEELVRRMGYSRVSAVNDCLLALAAAFGSGPGAVLVCGTGSIAFGRDAQGRVRRFGGWGHIFDDHGSAYWIGKEAIRRAFCSYDGRAPKTALEGAVQQAYGVDDLPLCAAKIYDEDFNKADIAQLATLVREHALNGDAESLGILKVAAAELGILAGTALDAAYPHQSLVVSGGTIENNEILLGLLEDELGRTHPWARVRKIDKEPVWGAVYLAAMM